MVLMFHKDKVPSMRKKYDRLREKADRIKDKNRKIQILRLLDQLEPTLISLEEQDLPKFEKRRMISYVGDNLEGVTDLLKEKKDARESRENSYGSRENMYGGREDPRYSRQGR